MQLSSPSPVLDLFPGANAAGGTVGVANPGGEPGDAPPGAFGALLNAQSKESHGASSAEDGTSEDSPLGAVLGQQPIAAQAPLTAAEAEALALLSGIALNAGTCAAGETSAAPSEDVTSGTVEGRTNAGALGVQSERPNHSAAGQPLSRVGVIPPAENPIDRGQSAHAEVEPAGASTPLNLSADATTAGARTGGLAKGSPHQVLAGIASQTESVSPTVSRDAASGRVDVTTRTNADSAAPARPIAATAGELTSSATRDSTVAMLEGAKVTRSNGRRAGDSPVVAVSGKLGADTNAASNAAGSVVPEIGERGARAFSGDSGSQSQAGTGGEKFAAENDVVPAMPRRGNTAEQKHALGAEQQKVAQRSITLGINAAKPDSLMSASALSTSPASAENEPMSLAAVPLTFESLMNEVAETHPLEASGSARRAVESVMAVVDQAAHGSRRGVNLQFSVSGMDVAVRVEMRPDGVHTTFQTDSPELRTALAQEWHAVVASQSADRAQRLVEPVFTSTSAGGPTSADTGASQQRESGARQSQWETATNPAPPASLRPTSAAPASAIPATPRLVPHLTARHLHTFA